MVKVDLSDKRALITGSTRGIGKTIAQVLAQAKAKVIITGRDEKRASEIAEQVRQDYDVDALGVEMNLADVESIKRAFTRIEEAFGTVDILVNNAGITKDRLFLRMSLEDWEDVIKVNLTGTFLVTSLAVKGMLKNRWGRVVNISSIVGFIGNMGQVNYATTKAGLVGFTKSLAKELASRNVTVNAVAPGFIETDMTSVLPEDVKGAYLKNIPLGRFGKPEDVAYVVAFLCSDLASYITGEVIHVNGGMW